MKVSDIFKIFENHIIEHRTFKENVEKVLHKYGNKLDIHEKQIYLIDKETKLLDNHREKQQMEIIVIKGQQDHAANAMERLSESLDKLTNQIGGLFNLKNMVVGGFITVTFISSAILVCLKLFLDYYK